MRIFSLSFSVLVFTLMTACSSETMYYDDIELEEEQILLNSKLPAFGAYISPSEDWDGVIFFPKAICSADGGNATSPSIIVENIPYGTNVILLEFNNISKAGLHENGGLGTVGYHIPENAGNFELLPIKGESLKLPSYAFLEKNHKIKNKRPAAYLPPCKNWSGDEISATVKAVKRTGNFEQSETQVLGITEVYLGMI